MTTPVKFDFSSYTPAIRAIPAIREREESEISAAVTCYSCDSAIPEQETRLRIAESQESQRANAKNIDALPNSRIAGIAAVYDDFQDDRRHCRECRNLRNGYCTAQRFRPVDDIPRRCDDFASYANRAGASSTPSIANLQVEATILFNSQEDDPLIVTVWTPSGTPMTIKADNTEHAAWLKQMNPKPANANPANFANPEPDDDRISEAEHNADGRFFKFLATWPDGSQCYLCQMPRMTLAEMLVQYPTATKIEPIEGEGDVND